MEEFTMLTEKYYILLIALTIWSIPWKGFALWKSSRRGEKVWFIVFLLVNTIGFLEIIYLFYLSETKKNNSKECPRKKII